MTVTNGESEDMDDILTVEEAMAYLKIGRTTLLKLTRDGDIPARKVGRAWRYTKENLQAFVMGETAEPVVEAILKKSPVIKKVKKKETVQKNKPFKTQPTVTSPVDEDSKDDSFDISTINEKILSKKQLERAEKESTLDSILNSFNDVED